MGPALLCLATLFSCKNEPLIPEDNADDMIEMPAGPSDDALAVTMDKKVYVFPYEYSGEGKAVAARATNQVPLDSEELEAVIIHGSQVGTLDDATRIRLLRLLAGGGAFIVVEPELYYLDQFCIKLSNLIDTSDKALDAIDEYLPSPAVDRILQWAEYSPFEDLEDTDETDPYEIIGIRAQSLYLSDNEKEGVPVSETSWVEFNDPDKELGLEGGRLELQDEDVNEWTDYGFGLKADSLAEWVNADEQEEDEAEAAEVKSLMETKAGISLEKIAKSQRITHQMNNSFFFQTSPHYGTRKNHPIQFQYDIWSAYSKEKQSDFYCVKQRVTLHNEELKCGPSDEYKWYNAAYYSKWKMAREKYEKMGAASSVSKLSMNTYGPFLYDFEQSVWIDGEKPSVENSTPKNSTSGGVTVTDSFTYGVGANVGFSGGKPAANLSLSATWGTSVARFHPDLSLTAGIESNGRLKWAYVGKKPESSFRVFGENKHDTATQIQTNTCVLESAWVWSLKTNKSTLSLVTEASVTDAWLIYIVFAAKCFDGYLPERATKTFKASITCPPRYTQEWTMNVTTRSLGASASKIEDYLQKHLADYFWTRGFFSTYKPTHRLGDKRDEIALFVAKSMDVFEKNKSGILKQAAREGGERWRYTINWTNVSTGKSEFSYTVYL